MTDALEINTGDAFPRLEKAPITEAVIEIRSRAMVPWDEAKIITTIKEKAPDYPKTQSLRDLYAKVKLEAGGKSATQLDDMGWSGIRAETKDQLQIAQFHRDRFSFSRLEPYGKWDVFQDEALRLWHIHCEIAGPTEIERLGIRFINQLSLPPEDGLDLKDYFQEVPQSPTGLELPISGFLHRENFVVPGHPYAINVTRTIQPPQKAQPSQAKLILDIDVSTVGPLPLDDTLLKTVIGDALVEK